MFATRLDDIVEEAKRIAREIIAPDAARIDQDAEWPERGLRTLQAAGLGGLVIPRDKGGLGHGLLALVRVCEVLGEVCPSTALCFGMHCVGTAVIAAKATPLQREKLLKPIIEGHHLTTLALSESGTGSYIYYPQTTMVPHDDGYRLNGHKAFVTNGGYADSYVLSAVMGGSAAEPGHFSCVVVEQEAPGLYWGERWTGIGMRGNASRKVELKDVLVRREYLLGSEGDQLWYFFEIIAPYFLMAMAGAYLGIAEGALGEVREHLGKRRFAHSGSPLGHQPIPQHRLGLLWGQVERTRQLIYFAATEGDAGGEKALFSVLAAKAEVADCVVGIVNEAMTLVGGQGYASNSRLSRCLRDARAAHVMSPTTDLLRLWLGRALLGLPLLAE